MTLIYLIAGEASGDALGAGLMQSLKTLHPDIQFAGIGGAQMQQEGLNSLFNYSELSVMGFLEIVPHIPKFIGLLNKTVEDIAAKKPCVIVTIDSPGFNFYLAKKLRANPVTRHIKRVHYVAPTVWAYKPKRAQKTANLFDALLVLLPFEPRYFEKHGLKTYFVGHRVLWQEAKGNNAAFRQKHGFTMDDKLLLLLPGSRKSEVKRHLALFLAAARALPDYKIVIIAGEQVVQSIHEQANEHVICTTAEKQDAFAAATMALSKSGTITLELAIAGVATVIAHKVNAFSAWLIRRMLLIPYASLVNIALNKEVVPELIQERCNVEEITKELILLSDSNMRELQLSHCKEAIAVLRSGVEINPDMASAKAIVEIVEQYKKPSTH